LQLISQCPVQALQAGFDWYHAFNKDAQANSSGTAPIDTPPLYLRDEFEGGDMGEYLSGFHTVGISSITAARIPGRRNEKANASGSSLIATRRTRALPLIPQNTTRCMPPF
jgi:hypothetical protein